MHIYEIINQFIYLHLRIPFIITCSRILQNYLFHFCHYTFFKSNTFIKPISQDQLHREKYSFYEAMKIYFGVLCIFTYLIPNMFYSQHSVMKCFIYTALSHIIVSEPFYYFTHRILHTNNIYHLLHYYHHLSYHTIPSTGLVQHSIEHLIYTMIFAPAILIPYIYFQKQHWISICFYFLLHDLCNAIGHSNISYPSSYYQSFMKYLFYSPAFHNVIHHTTFKYNYSLFMPIWDYLFNTYQEPIIEKQNTNVVNFVFIVHYCGMSSILTSQFICIYNVYDKWRIYVNIYFDFFVTYLVNILTYYGLQITYLYNPIYNIVEKYKGQVVILNKSPIHYLFFKQYDSINKDIIQLIKKSNIEKKTKYFGLANLNKMKILNDNGILITEELKRANLNDIKILTGDTMTTACLYQTLITLKSVYTFYYIGGTGKIGKALIKLLAEKGLYTICVYSTSRDHYEKVVENIIPYFKNKIIYSNNLNDIRKYSHAIIGKLLIEKEINIIKETKYMLHLYDYNVPFIPIKHPRIFHNQIGVLENHNQKVLDGYFDINLGLSQRQIYACYAGCILGFISRRETHEVGDINLDEIGYYWELGKKYGFTLPPLIAQ